ncbi:TolC family type I secretion outer membrane protein [Pseudomonas sp. FH4]|jgi:adhesin transport system outer membrane protein|uniref:Outer membrane protein, adhesin transport system n=1 Tax=Pseudomonas brenneri TaxID=129817 RepID=A0A5B2UST3_9PSED|nr:MULTISPECIES: TolC family outer membrane protein [Pseudomonas]KAA6172285.1 TolC family outer membrane protein [Pseudomonas marginalis]ETK21414.1 TolC family type I secretion outer membrane protein [Pseudomonas sp. FH4]KAA2229029.1 TolC family outer membrane protein [Pseudomonas brenneri]MBF8004718.1 TolC family outer membrane protein [Pseudomonas brenneri]MBT9302185.1 TolC family outer membrane protein [Pseudomonas sp. TAE6080]
MRLHLLKAIPFVLAASFVQAQTLPQAMQQALDVHPEIQAGVNARIAADYQLRAAKGGYLPRVDLNAGYGREGTDSSSTRARGGHWDTLNRGESSLRLQQMVFDGFATSSEVGRQQATVNSRAFSLLGTSERTALTVAQVYLDVLTRREFVRLAEDNLRNHERIYDQIKLRTQRGVGSGADLDQAEARLAQARNNVITEQTNLADAQTNYLSAVGQDADQLERPPSFMALLPANLNEARRQMLDNSPILRSAESDIAAAEKQYEAAKSSFYPRFDAELGRNADNNIDGDASHNNGWEAMLRMRFNLYAGGSNKAELESKSYQSNQALDIRNNALRQLNEELGLAWNAMNNANAQVPIAQQYVDHSSKVRGAYQKQFSLGERTLLDLLDSENELFTASRRLEEIKNVQLFTQYRIKATMGELLKSQGVVAPMASVVQNDVKPKVQLPGMN